METGGPLELLASQPSPVVGAESNERCLKNQGRLSGSPFPVGWLYLLVHMGSTDRTQEIINKKKKAWSWEGDDVGEYWGKLEGEVVLGGYDQNTL